MADWKTTSEAGFKFEDFCLDEVQKKFPLAYKNMKREDYSFYDIILFNGSFASDYVPKTVECKYDEMSYVSGNICIETGCYGRSSGLLITKADYWMIGNGHEMFLIERTQISQCIVDNMNEIMYRKNHPIKQEDGVVKDMNFYLIPKRIFIKYCLEYGDIDKLTYDKLI